MRRVHTAFAVLAFALLIAPAAAHKAHVKSIEITHPWVRAMPCGTTLTAGYAKITNKGEAPDRLIAASLEGALKAELHETTTANGVSSMRAVAGGIEIPPGATVTLATGGLHIMFLDVAKPLEAETYVPGSLTFEKAGRLDLEFYVEPLAPKANAAAEQHAH